MPTMRATVTLIYPQRVRRDDLIVDERRKASGAETANAMLATMILAAADEKASSISLKMATAAFYDVLGENALLHLPF